jgi:hypothetical protein
MTGVTEPLLQLCCLDSSIAIRPVMTFFKVIRLSNSYLPAVTMPLFADGHYYFGNALAVRSVSKAA